MRPWERAKWECQLSQNPALPSILVQRDAPSSSGSQRMKPLVLVPTEPSVPTLGKFTLVCSHQEFKVGDHVSQLSQSVSVYAYCPFFTLFCDMNVWLSKMHMLKF